jgi:hypothetical protein
MAGAEDVGASPAERILPAHIGDSLGRAVESSDAPFAVDCEHAFIDRIQDRVGGRIQRNVLHI